MKKPIVAVVFGSRSTEHDISVLTALSSVIKPLELSKKYTVLPVYIAKNGKWYTGEDLKHIAFFQSGDVEEKLHKRVPVSLLFDDGLKIIEGGRFKRIEHKVDVVFPATHGTHGEDGELMAICEMAQVPYVGCDVESSIVAMDKVLAKLTAQAANIPVTKFRHFTKTEYLTNSEECLHKINEDLRYPLFVKPAHLGSSIGISRVTDAQDLANAVEIALHYDTRALVEEAVQNLTEVTLPIIGNNDVLTPALLEEPLLKNEDFFDFETKYMQGGKSKGGATGGGKGGAQGYSRIPAELPKGLYEVAEAVGLSVYRALGCSGIARVDMLIDTQARQVYFNEVNPLPGSLYAHNWSKTGLSNTNLTVKLIELALERFKAKATIATSFSTNYLQQF